MGLSAWQGEGVLLAGVLALIAWFCYHVEKRLRSPFVLSGVYGALSLLCIGRLLWDLL